MSQSILWTFPIESVIDSYSRMSISIGFPSIGVVGCNEATRNFHCMSGSPLVTHSPTFSKVSSIAAVGLLRELEFVVVAALVTELEVGRPVAPRLVVVPNFCCSAPEEHAVSASARTATTDGVRVRIGWTVEVAAGTDYRFGDISPVVCQGRGRRAPFLPSGQVFVWRR